MLTEDNIKNFQLLFIILFVLSSAVLCSLKFEIGNNEIDYLSKSISLENGTRVEYYDSQGRPYAPWGEYTAIERYYNSDGKTEMEWFYSGQNKSTSYQGQNGNRYHYGEHIEEVTFVDSNGTPMNGKFGYSKIKRTLYDDGTIKDEMYYNTENMQVKLSGGQYGIRHVKDKIYYLDKNGVIMFDFDVFIAHNPWIVVIIGVFLCLLFYFLKKYYSIIFLICYFIFIILQTVIRSEKKAGINMNLMWSYREFFSDYNMRKQIIHNIWLFIPFGAGLYSILNKYWAWIVSFIVSVIIEVTQLVLEIGICELDDIINNTIGAIIGVLILRNIFYLDQIGFVKRKRG